jgi:hypothetical protein
VDFSFYELAPFDRTLRHDHVVKFFSWLEATGTVQDVQAVLERVLSAKISYS